MILTLAAWAILAAVLPYVLRGRWLAADLVAAGAWSVALMASMAAIGDLLAGTAALEQARGAVAGAVLGALVAVAVSQTSPPGRGLAGPARHHLIGLPWQRNERAAQPRSEARRPRGGRLRACLQDQRPAGRAGPQAGQGDGGEPDGLRLAGLRAQPLPRLPLPGGPRAVRELRARPAQGAVGLPARALPPGAARPHQPSPGGVPHRRAPGARRVRHPGAAAVAARGGGGAAGRGRPVGGRLRAHHGLHARRATPTCSSPRTTAARPCWWATAAAAC